MPGLYTNIDDIRHDLNFTNTDINIFFEIAVWARMMIVCIPLMVTPYLETMVSHLSIQNPMVVWQSKVALNSCLDIFNFTTAVELR